MTGSNINITLDGHDGHDSVPTCSSSLSVTQLAANTGAAVPSSVASQAVVASDVSDNHDSSVEPDFDNLMGRAYGEPLHQSEFVDQDLWYKR